MATLGLIVVPYKLLFSPPALPEDFIRYGGLQTPAKEVGSSSWQGSWVSREELDVLPTVPAHLAQGMWVGRTWLW